MAVSAERRWIFKDPAPGCISGGEQQVPIFWKNEPEPQTPVDLEQRFKVALSEMGIITFKKNINITYYGKICIALYVLNIME